jgi:glyoxylase-like metal-dependent hydrolase (beta-lactamase superfamily II)
VLLLHGASVAVPVVAIGPYYEEPTMMRTFGAECDIRVASAWLAADAEQLRADGTSGVARIERQYPEWDHPLVAGGDFPPRGVTRVRADNAAPLTLDGTNTYVVAGWVVDPGPEDKGHLEKVFEAVSAHGSPAGIVLTHGHPDHSEGADELARRAGGIPVVRPSGGERVGPFGVIATPGHSPDHVCLLLGRVLFTGDTVLGAGSVFLTPGEGALSAYLGSLRRLLELDPEALCPGHGPFVWRPRERIEELLAHRIERERGLVAGLEAGARSVDELLDAAWSEVPDELRAAATLTLAAHLDKLAGEERLPEGVERPALPAGMAEATRVERSRPAPS